MSNPIGAMGERRQRPGEVEWPHPTPNQGWAAISASASCQTAPLGKRSDVRGTRESQSYATTTRPPRRAREAAAISGLATNARPGQRAAVRGRAHPGRQEDDAEHPGARAAQEHAFYRQHPGAPEGALRGAPARPARGLPARPAPGPENRRNDWVARGCRPSGPGMPRRCIGAGPTGLVLALWLTKLGVKVRIIDKTAEPGTTSRALAVQARTLELYRQLDLADAVVARGHKVPAVNLWVKGEQAARAAVRARRRGPDALSLPAHLPAGPARAAADRAAGGARRRGRAAAPSCSASPTTATGVTARLRGPDGARRTARPATSPAATARARPCARRIGTGFPGGTYRQVFYVADVEAAGPAAQRRAARRPRRGRLPGRLPAGRRGPRAADRHGARRARRPRRNADVRGRQRPRDRPPEGRGRQGELVLDLSRASPRDASISARAAPSCSATPRTSTARPAARA